MAKTLQNCFLILCIIVLQFNIGCKSNSKDTAGRLASENDSAAVTITEGFETGTKTSYSAADVTLGTGTWNLDDALIGNSKNDAKDGAASVRIRNLGKITMKFDLRSGAGTVLIKHAKYGTDGASMWSLWYSLNSGSTWSQAGTTVTASSKAFQTASFYVNKTGPIRFEIRKTSGKSNRINIDDISISGYSSGAKPSSTAGNSSIPAAAAGNINLTMGNPSSASPDINNQVNYLLDKPQFCASYNRGKGIPNWVSWQLNSDWCNGNAVRKDNFIPDASLPDGWYRVTPSDYRASGFSRGHMCPSADRVNTQENNDAVFVMTNMVPQNQINNAEPWEGLEAYCRTLANAGNVLYIICGPYGSGGTGTNGYAESIAGGKVVVPAKLWKVILVLPNGTNDLSRVTASTRTIAVIMNNDNGPYSNWGAYRVSVDQIESLTGYDFFSNVPASIQSAIESKVDKEPIF